MHKNRLTLMGWIFAGLASGTVVGLLQHLFLPSTWNNLAIQYLFDPVGTMFLNGIRLTVVPLVLVSLTLGTAAIGDVRRLGRIGGKTLAIYLVTTVVAIAIGLTLAMIIRPGVGLVLPAETSFRTLAPRSMKDLLVGVVPTNPFTALSEGNMLQVIFVALLVGLGISAVGEAATSVIRALRAAEAIVQKIVHIVMCFAPFGVFALMAKVVIGQGTAVFVPLAKYCLVVIGALLAQTLLVYPAMLAVLGRLDPLCFFQRVYPAMLVAFSTSSSNATLPVSMAVAREQLGVKEDLYSFTLPLGATINMDGTAIMQAVATVFIANVCGVTLGATEFLKVVMLATLASIGTAGIPSGGIVMLTMILSQLGLPFEGVALVLGVDRVLDMSRTVVNVTGDLMTTAVLARSERVMNHDVFAGSVKQEGG